MSSVADGAPASRGAQSATAAQWLLVVAIAVPALVGPALWNGFALLQHDTGGYLASWYEGYLLPSRPGAYGLVLLAGITLSFWPSLLMQAGLTVWVLALVLRTLGLGARPLLLLAVIVALSVTTALPWLTSILLTDIFAGLAVLALHLLAFHADILQRWERRGLVALTAFAAATHSATLLVIGALALAAVTVGWLRRDLVPSTRYAVIGAVLGIAVSVTANFAAGRVAWTPGGYAIAFGRMLQDGIVDRYLKDHCREEPLKLCPYRLQLPQGADEFLWGDGVFNRLGRFAGLGNEMRKIVLESLREYPALQALTAIRATARQLVHVGTGEGQVATIWHTYGTFQRYAPSVVAAMRSARQQRGELRFEAINLAHVPIALLSMALLPALVIFGWRHAGLARLGLLAATIAAALLINAFVCGALSGPHDRYGSRLAWLAPLTIGLVLFSAGFPRAFLVPGRPLLGGRRRFHRSP